MVNKVSTQEKEDGKIETPQVFDRAYGTSYNYEPIGPHVLVTFTRYAEGFFLATPPSVKERTLQPFQQHLQDLYEKEEIHLPRKKRFLLTCDVDRLKAEMLAAIHRETDTYKVWTSGPADVDAYIGHQVMTGHAPSRRSARRADVPSKYSITLMSPIYKAGAGINYLAFAHDCPDFVHGIGKIANVVCVHIAAVIKRAWDEQKDPSIPENRRRIKFVETRGPVYIPFIIDDIASMSIIFRKYNLREDMKDIDKRELDNPDNYDPLYLQAIESGEIVYEGIRQENKKIKPKDDRERRELEARVAAMKSLQGDFLRQALNRAGFRRVGLYALAFKGTPLETACETYEKDGTIVRPVFNMGLPPLLEIYRLSNEKQVFYEPSIEHPFAHINSVQEAVDDRTRRKGTRQIIIPGPDMIPELGSTFIHPVFRNDYRRLIQEHYQGNKEELLRKLGLHRLM